MDQSKVFAKLKPASDAVQSFSQQFRQYTSTLLDRLRNTIDAATGHNRMITIDEAARILHEELQYPQSRAVQFVRTFDKNGDGLLSLEELEHFKRTIRETKAQLVPAFREYDLDGNGSISLDEAATILSRPPFKFPAQKVANMLQQFDKDGNGKLDIDEFTGFYAEAKASNEEISTRFDELDTDGNGTLSTAELTNIIKQRMGFDDDMAQQFVAMFDENQDGQIDKTEFVNMWSNMFG